MYAWNPCEILSIKSCKWQKKAVKMNIFCEIICRQNPNSAKSAPRNFMANGMLVDLEAKAGMYHIPILFQIKMEIPTCIVLNKTDLHNITLGERKKIYLYNWPTFKCYTYICRMQKSILAIKYIVGKYIVVHMYLLWIYSLLIWLLGRKIVEMLDKKGQAFLDFRGFDFRNFQFNGVYPIFPPLVLHTK